MSDSVPPPPPPSSSGTPPPPPPPSSVPPPPPPSAVSTPPPPPPPRAVSTPPPPTASPAPYSRALTGAAPTFNPIGGTESGKPPRPRVKVGSILIIVGALVAIAGTFLPWANLGDETGTGFDSYRIRDNFDIIEFDSPGVVVLFLAGGLVGLGLALFFAGRVLAVAIISIIVASIGAIVGLVMVGLMSAVVDDVGGSIGYGVVMTPLGALASLVGAITATAKRRRFSSPLVTPRPRT